LSSRLRRLGIWKRYPPPLGLSRLSGARRRAGASRLQGDVESDRLDCCPVRAVLLPHRPNGPLPLPRKRARRREDAARCRVDDQEAPDPPAGTHSLASANAVVGARPEAALAGRPERQPAGSVFGTPSCQKPRCSSWVFIARGSGSTYEWTARARAASAGSRPRRSTVRRTLRLRTRKRTRAARPPAPATSRAAAHGGTQAAGRSGAPSASPAGSSRRRPRGRGGGCR
jgi:hypothetical protein